MKSGINRSVKRRDESFAEKTATKIWLEQPCEDNPYIAETVFCHGYELFELMAERSLADVIFLLCKGELPSRDQKALFEKLFIGLINPGPRHAATRAAMNAGVGKSHAVHILPIAATVMGGSSAAAEVETAMRFFRKSFRKAPDVVQKELSVEHGERWLDHLPGFGRVYGGIDVHAQKLASYFSEFSGAGEVMAWAMALSKTVHPECIGWLNTGIAAAVFCDLGLHPKFGGPLFQLMAAPGLIAHGLEMFTKPLTAMPYVKDENYVIEN